jgi:hypothetical protein
LKRRSDGKEFLGKKKHNESQFMQSKKTPMVLMGSPQVDGEIGPFEFSSPYAG